MTELEELQRDAHKLDFGWDLVEMRIQAALKHTYEATKKNEKDSK